MIYQATYEANSVPDTDGLVNKLKKGEPVGFDLPFEVIKGKEFSVLGKETLKETLDDKKYRAIPLEYDGYSVVEENGILVCYGTLPNIIGDVKVQIAPESKKDARMDDEAAKNLLEDAIAICIDYLMINDVGNQAATREATAIVNLGKSEEGPYGHRGFYSDLHMITVDHELVALKFVPLVTVD